MHPTGKASGANNAIRELGGVFGVAVLASIFSSVGGYQSGQSFVHGTTTAVYIGGGVVAALGAVAAALIRRRPRQAEVVTLDPSRCSRRSDSDASPYRVSDCAGCTNSAPGRFGRFAARSN
jgi:hypothetical protein